MDCVVVSLRDGITEGTGINDFLWKPIFCDNDPKSVTPVCQKVLSHDTSLPSQLGPDLGKKDLIVRHQQKETGFFFVDCVIRMEELWTKQTESIASEQECYQTCLEYDWALWSVFEPESGCFCLDVITPGKLLASMSMTSIII